MRLREDLQFKMSEITGMTERISLLEVELARVSGRNETLEEANQTLRLGKGETNDDESDLGAECVALRKRVHDMHTELDEVSRMALQLQDENTIMKDELVILRKRPSVEVPPAGNNELEVARLLHQISGLKREARDVKGKYRKQFELYRAECSNRLDYERERRRNFERAVVDMCRGLNQLRQHSNAIPVQKEVAQLFEIGQSVKLHDPGQFRSP